MAPRLRTAQTACPSHRRDTAHSRCPLWRVVRSAPVSTTLTVHGSAIGDGSDDPDTSRSPHSSLTNSSHTTICGLNQPTPAMATSLPLLSVLLLSFVVASSLFVSVRSAVASDEITSLPGWTGRAAIQALQRLLPHHAGRQQRRAAALLADAVRGLARHRPARAVAAGRAGLLVPVRPAVRERPAALQRGDGQQQQRLGDGHPRAGTEPLCVDEGSQHAVAGAAHRCGLQLLHPRTHRRLLGQQLGPRRLSLLRQLLQGLPGAVQAALPHHRRVVGRGVHPLRGRRHHHRQPGRAEPAHQPQRPGHRQRRGRRRRRRRAGPPRVRLLVRPRRHLLPGGSERLGQVRRGGQRLAGLPDRHPAGRADHRPLLHLRQPPLTAHCQRSPERLWWSRHSRPSALSVCSACRTSTTPARTTWRR